jgi:hypothetical protein
MPRLVVSLLGSLHVIRQRAWRTLALERLVRSFFKRYTPATM